MPEAHARESKAKATRREWIGLAVIALPCVLYSMDLTVLNLAVPHLSADLKPTSAQLLWILDIYGFLVAGSLITMGRARANRSASLTRRAAARRLRSSSTSIRFSSLSKSDGGPMHPMIRSALVLLAGVIAAVLVVVLMDAVVGRIYPLTAGTDLGNPESMRQAIAAPRPESGESLRR